MGSIPAGMPTAPKSAVNSVFHSSRHRLTAREAFRLNEHPDELMRRYPESEWGSVLREIDCHQHELDARRTPEQAEWARAGAGRRAVSTGRAAERIVRLTPPGE
jgi:hypothetical protein